MDLDEQQTSRAYETLVEAIAWGEFCFWPKPMTHKNSPHVSGDYHGGYTRRETRGIDRVSLSFNTGKSGAIRQLCFEGCRKPIRFD